MTTTVEPFGVCGSEKMVYDLRMGPVAVLHQNAVWTVYPANGRGPRNHPHIRRYDLVTRTWSEPVQVGSVPWYDHHFNPILWFDPQDHIHVLFGCHGANGGTHLVSARPLDITDWHQGPEIAPSITYPHVMPLGDGRLLMYHRVFIHLGYWTYRMSEDGGFTWSNPGPLIDMDQRPETDQDTWSGSYHSVMPSLDRKSLHIAFVRLDEARRVNPRYQNRFTTNLWLNKYDLNYCRLDLSTGELTNIDGESLELPLNRAGSERCRVWNSDWRLTNIPALQISGDDQPLMMLPSSCDSPWQCTFQFIRRVEGAWLRTPVGHSNIPWSSALFRQGGAGTSAYLVCDGPYGETVSYGGGKIQEWAVAGDGDSWQKIGVLEPVPGLIYNNPRHVETAEGKPVKDMLVMFGWEGPGGIQRTYGDRGGPYNRGQAFLWHQGVWL